MKKILSFFRRYYLFGIAVLTLIVSLILQFTHHALVAHWILGIVAIAEVLPLLVGMWQDLRDGSYGIDILATAAIVTSVVMHQYWAGIVVVLMLTGGEALEDYAEHRAKTELNALLSKSPKLAHVIRGKQTLEVPVAEVRIGDKLIIKPGEVVPVDAVIIEGQSSFDESSLTGESLPQFKEVNAQLLSGSVNLDGVVQVKALRAAAESQYEQIIKLVRAAGNSQTPFVRLADRYSVPFTAIAFIIAIGSWVVSGQSIRFLEVLVVATPCPLILAAPIAVISGMSRAARHGIIIKTGSALERLAEVRTIAFDKTGTLTEGQPIVDTIRSYGSFKKPLVLSLAAALEQSSNHVLAQAITSEATRQKIKVPKARNIKEQSGLGLMGTVQGKQVLVGRLSLLREHNIKLPPGFKESEVEQTATWVAIGGQLAGVISFGDAIRKDSKKTLTALSRLGIRRFIMVTGDNKATANLIAKKLGIKEVRAEALPVDKLRAIENIEENDRPVAFVGDGVNDAPVLLAADIGIALGARGETAASESADMVILLNDIGRVATSLSVAKRTFAIAKQSILVGIALSIGLMFVFATGHFRPLYGAIIQEGVDIIVIFNALRAHGGGRTLKA